MTTASTDFVENAMDGRAIPATKRSHARSSPSCFFNISVRLNGSFPGPFPSFGYEGSFADLGVKALSLITTTFSWITAG